MGDRLAEVYILNHLFCLHGTIRAFKLNDTQDMAYLLCCAFNFLIEYVLVVNKRYACIQKNMHLPWRPGAVALVSSFLQNICTISTLFLKRPGNEVLDIVNRVRILWPRCFYRVVRIGTSWQRHFLSTSNCLAFSLLHLNHPAHRAPLNANPGTIQECDMGSWGLSSLQKERSLFVEGPLHAWMNG